MSSARIDWGGGGWHTRTECSSIFIYYFFYFFYRFLTNYFYWDGRRYVRGFWFLTIFLNSDIRKSNIFLKVSLYNFITSIWDFFFFALTKSRWIYAIYNYQNRCVKRLNDLKILRLGVIRLYDILHREYGHAGLCVFVHVYFAL